MDANLKSKPHTDNVIIEEVPRICTISQNDVRIGMVSAISLAILWKPWKSIAFTFKDGVAIVLPISMFTELGKLTDEQLKKMELGFNGSALVLESEDLHIAIAGLIGSSQSIREIAAAL